jgi:hypothetical protein
MFNTSYIYIYIMMLIYMHTTTAKQTTHKQPTHKQSHTTAHRHHSTNSQTTNTNTQPTTTPTTTNAHTNTNNQTTNTNNNQMFFLDKCSSLFIHWSRLPVVSHKVLHMSARPLLGAWLRGTPASQGQGSQLCSSQKLHGIAITCVGNSQW